MNQDSDHSPGNPIALLEASFADERLSDEERRMLSAALSDSHPREENLRRARNKAFEIAREKMADHADSVTLLRWLEGVMRAIDAARTPAEAARPTVCFSPGDACLRLIVEQLRRARQSLDICVFTLSDDRISAEILAAQQRGIALRIITDNDKESDEGSDVQRFRQAGIALAVDRTSAHMHHKFAIIDRKYLLNGSYNWTRSAAQHNEENLVLSADPVLLTAFSERFEKLWQALA